MRRILVIGGGIAGVESALTLAADPREAEAAAAQFAARAEGALRATPPYGSWLRDALGG